LAVISFLHFLVLNFLIVCILLIVLGSIMLFDLNHFDSEGDGTNTSTTPICVTVLGCLIFVVSFFGCFGIFKQSACMTGAYTIMVFVLFILQLVLTCWVFVNRNAFLGDMSNLLTLLWNSKDYNATSSSEGQNQIIQAAIRNLLVGQARSLLMRNVPQDWKELRRLLIGEFNSATPPHRMIAELHQQRKSEPMDTFENFQTTASDETQQP
ncbi:CD82 antigen-like, partial [Drosophila rhopaloa]|uniref:Uncharacterized protein n=1 Tax=Drosophila rhopaloa TaxID=1041015 RepID=A0ABM5J136_DRORH